ncbi:DeoR/GlpR family DNA-binding transcription regulator [Ruminiclostridium cellobioparum]|jgi:DeoR/GlpR family transcriptional regulator of sugar metabolism|uniref:DeoR/GlpR family DNA-binding transcription regulator n=1 Tax=Ruminiclostridium cellobioparum TaxID=29355 RepID=UPI00048566E0|nr:DeoR/GlpR family DNA-binding transcription regulator [Ruminiclostridium cellobioparum]
MLAIERHNRILKLLADNVHITTNELSELLEVSAATIRNDLNKLEKDKLILKTHGGATLLSPAMQRPQNIFPFNEREFKNSSEKEAISNMALRHIEEGQCIILDASSTALAVARKLGRFSRLTVITNGIYTMLALKDIPNITVIFIGGIVTKNSGSTEGLLGYDLLNHINADTAFVSAHGFTLKEGLTDFNIYEAELKKQMVLHSRKRIALLDHTKFEHISTASFCFSKDINSVITDEQIDPQLLSQYKNSGINIEVSPLS